MPKPLRVLIIEDSEDDSFFILREIQRSGFQPEYSVEAGFNVWLMRGFAFTLPLFVLGVTRNPWRSLGVDPAQLPPEPAGFAGRSAHDAGSSENTRWSNARPCRQR